MLEADRDLAPVVTLVGNWSVAKAREATWVTAQTLWELDSVPVVETEFLATLSSSVGMDSRFLLTPGTRTRLTAAVEEVSLSPLPGRRS